MIKIDLTGKIVLVTGATGQLGRVISKILAECGAYVIIHYNKNRKLAEQLFDYISNISKAYIVQADITCENSVNKMKQQINRNFGQPEIIVVTATIQYNWKTVLDQSLEDYESQFRSNIIQNVLVAKMFLPDMIKKKWGRIIALNTECAMKYDLKQSAYVSGKRGMDGLLRVLAREVGPYNITVNQVAPGWIISDNDRINKTEKQEVYERKVPLQRRGIDNEVANVVAFLASELASYITGVFLPVCGGNIMPSI